MRNLKHSPSAVLVLAPLAGTAALATTTPAMKTTASAARVLTDGELYLDWNNDGNGYGRHQFAASPIV